MPTKRKTTKSKRLPLIAVRLPDELEQWLRKQAIDEDRPLTRVVVRALSAERAKLEQAQAYLMPQPTRAELMACLLAGKAARAAAPCREIVLDPKRFARMDDPDGFMQHQMARSETSMAEVMKELEAAASSSARAIEPMPAKPKRKPNFITMVRRARAAGIGVKSVH
jgi:hypothetical protein